MNPKLSKLSATVCLFSQLFSIALPTFVPVIALAQNKPQTLAEITTTPYILKKGETVSVVAARYSLSVDALKKLNVFRTFSKPFEKLGEGDEIDVPVNNTTKKDTAGYTPEGADAFWANRASSLGNTLSSDHPADQAASMAKSMATGATVSTVEQWLGQFGTAKAKLNLDDDFTLDGSSLDVLLPLYDQQDNLLFTQLGYRNKDSRNTLNAGLGFRTFHGNWMYGINSFYDDDVTGNNRRLGVGLEAWTDYLKLGANSYTGLTDWHQSRDFADYDERPADGFDIRAEGWLPAYPQLGGKLVYEQYRGDEVALFNKDDRSSDPKAVTLGLNYTPVPLVTVGVDHRQGQSGQNDTSFNLEFNYELGLPWNQQIDDSLVAARRTLAGSRLDLVDRNNEIVLEYKKQDLIHLTLPALLEGKASDKGNISATVKAKYGVDHIEWDYSEILAAKGSAVAVNKQTLEITFPPYQTTGSNVYHISAVAYDPQHNKSNRETTEIRVSEPDATISDGNLIVTVDGAAANGEATDTVQAKVTDSAHHAVAGVKVEFTADNETRVMTASAVTDANGLATTNLTNIHAGKSNVTATVNGSARSVPVSFVADSGSAVIADGNLTVTRDNGKANNSDTNHVQAKVTDKNGNTVSGTTVSFSSTVSGATMVTASAVTDENGIAGTDLTSTMSGVVPVKAAVNGTDKSVDTHFAQDDSSATIGAGDFVLTTDNAKANGSATNAVKATVKDANGLPLAGVVVSFSATNGANVASAKATTDQSGVATTTLTSTKAGISAVTASVSNATGGSSQSLDAHFVADDSTATISAGNLTVTTDDAKADGSATNAVKAIVTDANGNVLAGQSVSFSASNGATVITASATTDADGVATTTLTNSKSGITSVTATVNGNSQSVDTTFLADSSTAGISSGNLTVTTDNAKADGSATNAVKAIVTDAKGNLVKDATVTFTATNGATITTASATTDVNGIATTTLSNTKAGVAKVTASVNGASQTVDTTFVADSGTATISDGNLTVTTDNAKANGTATNAVKAIVTDVNGNLVSGVAVTFTATNGATVTTASATTDADGIATTTLTNTKSGVAKVTASINGNSQSVDTTFVADSSTATISDGNLTVTTDNAKADGSDTDAVKAIVTDANGNLVSGVAVTFTATNGATVTTASATTDTDGIATTTLTNSKSGIAKVTATVNGASQTVDTTFVADSSTATISSGNLTVTTDGAKADGADTNAVKAIVTDAKGNLVKDVTVTFTATNGATVITTSATTDVDGIATTTLSNTTAGTAKVTATVNGNSQTVDTTFVADGGTATISAGNLTVTTDNAKANGSATNAVKAIVTDANGNPVKDAVVTFTATNGAVITTESATTDANGIATTTLSNTKAGVSAVTAKVNGNSQSVDTTFVADSSTATISSGNLTVTTDNAKADGTATDAVKAIVTDANGNLVSGVAVTFTATNGATITTASATTDADGIATTTLTNTKSGVSKVTATVNGASQTVDTTFVADSGTATLADGSLTVTTDNAKANGTATDAVKAIVTDANSNLVKDATLTFTATNGATITTASATTDADGIATTTLTNTKSGVAKVTATVNGASQTVDTTFVADSSTATITDGNLTVTTDNAKANGSATDAVKAIVTDANGNLVSGVAVTFTATNGATITTASATTDADGVATTTLTNTKAGIAKVTATVNGNSQTVDTTFVADSSTATISSGNLTVTTDNAKANGSATDAVKAIVTDANGNLVSGVAVTFTATNGATIVTESVTTDADGIATTTLTNTKSGVAKVTATVNGASQTVDTTFVADSSTATISDGNLTVTTDNAKANGTATDAVKAIVTDANGNLVKDATVAFTATNGATITTASATTDANGVATTTLTNTKAGTTSVTATVNGNSKSVDTTFVADSSTATISDGNLTVTTDNAVANDSDTNAVKAIVTDANGNKLKDATVTFTATNSAKITTASATTDADGVATTTLKNTKSGVSAVTATVNGTSKSVDTTFVADSSTATIATGNLTVTTDNAKADGTATDAVQAKVTDANGNLVPGVVVAFSVTTGATVVTASATTDAYGLAKTNLTSEKSGAYTVTATLGTASQTATVNFKADATTAVTTLTSDVTTQAADGESVIALTATVKDAKGNLVPNENVVFTTTGAATLGDATVTKTVATDASGQAKLNVTDATVETVTVAAKSSSNAGDTGGSVDLTFTAPPPGPMPSTTKIAVNGANFAVDGGFPKTGYDGAKFQIAIKGSAANNANYTWSDNSDWVSVDSTGTVTFSGEGTSDEVTITATPKNGGVPYEYKFQLEKWFKNPNASVNGSNPGTVCTALDGGYSLSAPSDILNVSDAASSGSAASRAAGGAHLWSEWGITAWGLNLWTSQTSGSNRGMVFMFSNSSANWSYQATSYTVNVACSKAL
ncbi:Ig-like domain-containing protein [Enterobacter asburiae]|uniref:Ig-like domain-containing protein n=1 Tax=Enterobacter asburiae TaxID=61645 RepID=UPI0018C2B675|nr:Ig-like domain-containing protein [Enterobacter asburiae]MBG0639189.1 Ig-like domain-containing protein [Enterobacter asburiae]